MDIETDDMTDADKIRALNDTFRRSLKNGRVVATRGIMALPNMMAILHRVRTFSDFNNGNDPHCEHDFGAFDYQGDLIFFKIDYYDLDMKWGSEDPADRNITTRLLTVMLAEEY